VQHLLEIDPCSGVRGPERDRYDRQPFAKTDFELDDVLRPNLGGQEPPERRQELRVKVEPDVRLLEGFIPGNGEGIP
jgi:hypothetical protein